MSEEMTGRDRMQSASVLEERLFHRVLAARERRQREERWLALVMHRKVVLFSDLQIAAELIARHRWEDAARREPPGAASCLEALKHLCELRVRREGWSKSEAGPPDGAA